MKKGFILPLLICLFMLISTSAFLYFKFNKKVNVTQSSNDKTSQNSQYSNNLPIDEAAFNLLSADPISANDTWFEDKKYPLEMLSYKADDLQRIKCTYIKPRFGEEPFFAINDNNVEFEVKDREFIKLLLSENLSDDPSIMSIRYCENSSNKFLIVGKWTGLMDNVPAVLISILDDKLSTKKIIKGASNGAPYFGCSSPTLLTKTNIMYLSCGGGDGPIGKSSIYKIDLNSQEMKIIYSCESQTYDLGDQNFNSRVSCS